MTPLVLSVLTFLHPNRTQTVSKDLLYPQQRLPNVPNAACTVLP